MILESIFRGNFTPLDLVVPDDPDYKNSIKRSVISEISWPTAPKRSRR